MKWLYPRYIRPYVEAAPREEYEMWLSLMESDLEYQFREELDKTLEFTAIHAGPGGAHSTRNGAICPRTFGVHTAVTAMVSPYSTFSTLASRYSWSSRPPLS